MNGRNNKGRKGREWREGRGGREGREGKGRQGEGRGGEGRGGEGRERSRGYSPQIWNSVLAPAYTTEISYQISNVIHYSFSDSIIFDVLAKI
jgi:hypothetical protein